MESTRVFVDNVDTYLSRIPAIIAQQIALSVHCGTLSKCLQGEGLGDLLNILPKSVSRNNSTAHTSTSGAVSTIRLYFLTSVYKTLDLVIRWLTLQ
ncbi:hypothetical protein V1524DRAFT_444277 [Lipomyces starkeyi]